MRPVDDFFGEITTSDYLRAWWRLDTSLGDCDLILCMMVFGTNGLLHKLHHLNTFFGKINHFGFFFVKISNFALVWFSFFKSLLECLHPMDENEVAFEAI